MKYGTYAALFAGLGMAFSTMGCDPKDAAELAAAEEAAAASATSESSEITATPQTRVDISAADTISVDPSYLASIGAVKSESDFRILEYKVVDRKGKAVDKAGYSETATGDVIEKVDLKLADLGVGIYYLKLVVENTHGKTANLTLKLYQNDATTDPTAGGGSKAATWAVNDDGKMMYFDLQSAIDQGLTDKSSVTLSLDSLTDAKGGKIDTSKICREKWDKMGPYEVDCMSGMGATGGTVIFSDGKNKKTVTFKIGAAAKALMEAKGGDMMGDAGLKREAEVIKK